jgi:uncharacterized membrane protein
VGGILHTIIAVAAPFGIQPYVFWPYVAGGVLALLAALVASRDLSQSSGWDKFLALMPVFLAPPIAAFGAEHLLLANFIQLSVPAWIPWHLFWAYFVGVALFAAAFSIATHVQVRWSGSLLGIMLFLFVLNLHVPKVIATPHDRIAWAVLLRDISFACGAWALAGSQSGEWRDHRGTSNFVTVSRVVMAIIAVVFGVEHFLHPECLPGVPLAKLTPLWVPARLIVGYLTGAFLVAAGISLLASRMKRLAATGLGLWLVLLVLFIYLPMVIAIPSSADGGAKIEGVNYFFDTLMYAGAVLALATALPKPNYTD